MKVSSIGKTSTLVQPHPCTGQNAVRTPRPVKTALTVRCSHGNAATAVDRRRAEGWDRQLGKRWKEYQGIGNWDGLLDPLDENLRREILRYGGFVDAAYKSFDSDPKVPNDSLLLREASGYSLTRHLRATSGFSWAPPEARSSWIGFAAVCTDRDEIDRLGRRDAVVALRGTATALEWLENLRTGLAPVGPDNPGPMVESGFLSLYTSGEPSLRGMLREEVARLLRSYGGDGVPLSLTITGHSLGAALATLAAYDVKTHFGSRAPLVTVMSFGGPRVGNRSFRSILEKQGTKVLRIVNSDDVVTKVPGFVLDSHVSMPSKSHVAGLPRWIRTRWAYAEVGEELRLSSRDSPCLPGNYWFYFVTCHDLATYLHLVENFVSSTCPFRATARKLLRKTAATKP